MRALGCRTAVAFALAWSCGCADRSLVLADRVSLEAGMADGTVGSAGDAAHEACSLCTLEEICLDGACKPKGSPVTPTFAACSSPPCINVYNACPIPLFIHPVTDGTVVIDQGRIHKLENGEQVQYGGLTRIAGGRIYAYYEQPSVSSAPVQPVSSYNQFIEMNVHPDSATGRTVMNYDVSYVDYAALPVSLQAIGDCKQNICGAPMSDWKQKLLDCPTEVRNAYAGLGTCIGSYNYCITKDGAATFDSTREYCTKMTAVSGYTGSQVYGGVFPEHGAQDVAFWDQIAAYNRNTSPGNPNANEYYLVQPYNDYARWIHRELGCQAYAFSTDNHQNSAGSAQCTSDELDVVFCPYD